MTSHVFDPRDGIPKSQCPRCHTKINAATCAEHLGDCGCRPEPGDLSLCYNCGEINVFDAKRDLMIPADLDSLLAEMDERERGLLLTGRDWVRRGMPR